MTAPSDDALPPPSPPSPLRSKAISLVQAAIAAEVPHIWIKNAIREAGGEYVMAVPEADLPRLILCLSNLVKAPQT